MAGEESQEEALKQQKANCIFCKIVAGEIPSRRVYEDDKAIAILDINPAAKGHTLVLTKEHYPIMPLIPPEEFDHLFGATAALSGAVSKAMIAKRCTTFIANGAVAGQQSPHFLFHLVPREDGDKLPFEVPRRGVNQSDIATLMKQNLYSVMRQHLTKTGKLSLLQVGQAVAEKPPAAAPAPAQQAMPPAAPQALPTMAPIMQPLGPPRPRLTPDQLADVIEQNPELKALLVNNPAKLQRIVEETPEFKPIFAGVDIMKLGERMRQAITGEAKLPADGASGQDEYEPEQPEEKEEPKQDEVKPAKKMSLKELFAFIDSKPKLRDYILGPPSELKAIIPENPRLSKFFEGSNVDAIILAYQEHTHEERREREQVEPETEKTAADMSLEELFAFIDSKPKLRDIIVYSPDRLKELLPQNEKLARFFKGSNLLAIIQAYQEHAKEMFDVRVTMEPEEPSKPGEVRQPPGPTRKESGEAYEEMRNQTKHKRDERWSGS